jgi:hypothetical protein
LRVIDASPEKTDWAIDMMRLTIGKITRAARRTSSSVNWNSLTGSSHCLLQFQVTIQQHIISQNLQNII